MHFRLPYLAGPLAGIIFFSAVYGLAPMLGSYSHVAQTVSEIGKYGSPAKIPFQAAVLTVAFCLLVFAGSLYRFAKSRGASLVPSCLMAVFGFAEMGMAIFPSPHPLHNVFGLSAIIGYLTPLAVAVAWRNLRDSSSLRRFAWVAFALVVLTMFLNLSPIFSRDLYPLEYYGIVQRSLLLTFFGWCFYVGVDLYVRTRPSDARRIRAPRRTRLPMGR